MGERAFLSAHVFSLAIMSRFVCNAASSQHQQLPCFRSEKVQKMNSEFSEMSIHGNSQSANVNAASHEAFVGTPLMRSRFVGNRELRASKFCMHRLHSQSHHYTIARRRIGPRMDWQPAGLMREIVDLKKYEIDMMEDTLQERPDHPVNLRRSFYASQPTHRFSSALRRKDGSLAIVGAIKRFQPPRPGEKSERLRDFNEMVGEVQDLEAAGLDAAMMFTDMLRYGVEVSEIGSVANALKVSNVDLGMPIARQDVIIDPIQIAEAAEAGACAVNIVAAAALPDLMDLLNATTMMGLEAIVECHTELERDFAMECGATMLYLTNWDKTRNLLVPGTAEKLAEDIPPWVLTMVGGGLQSASECWRLLDLGVNAVVLGRSLLQTRRPAGFIKEIKAEKRYTGDIFSGDWGVPFSEGMDE